MPMHNYTLLGLAKRDASAEIQSSLGVSGVDLIAMVVSDSGLANAEPKWWNASPIGCMLIGLQPRGGWQIIQRAVQWGNDAWAHCFGVDCQSPTLHAYFACSIRNRLEVLDSDRFRSPMEGVPPGGAWASDGDFTVKRPTKLIDGSRGGQAFMAELLVPDGEKHYTVAEQARLQLQSVLLVGAGLTKHDYLPIFFEVMMAKDFDITDNTGSVFGRLAAGLGACSMICVVFMIATWWSLFRENLFGNGLPYVVKVLSLAFWAVGGTGLLMLGGNPRVIVTKSQCAAHIMQRLDQLRGALEPDIIALPHEAEGIGANREGLEDERQRVSQMPSENNEVVNGTSEVGMVNQTESLEEDISSVRGRRSCDTLVRVQFGSLHGSIFTPDQGHCRVSSSLVERICNMDIKLVRSHGWYAGIFWFGLSLLASIALQIAGSLAPAFAADLMSLAFLLLTSLARGAGVSGSEEWMIPKWRRRKNTTHGAVLIGQFSSRMGGEEV